MSGGHVVSVSSQAALNAAIEALDQTTVAGHYTIALSGNITESAKSGPGGIYALDVGNGVDVTIAGHGHNLNGAGQSGGLAVLGGKVTITNLTIEDTLAQGKTGDNGGGGGAGVGGGLFVGASASVAVDNVKFSKDSAKGGNGGVGSGGGGGASSLLVAPVGSDGAAGAAGQAGTLAMTVVPGHSLGSTEFNQYTVHRRVRWNRDHRGGR